MIFGQLSSIEHTANYLPAEIYQLLLKLKHGDFNDLAIGRHEYRGDTIYISADEYQTSPAHERRYEFHRRYADLQVILSGEERIYLAAPDNNLLQNAERFKDSDCWFVGNLDDTGFIQLKTGSFLLILPGQLHKPCCNHQDQSPVKKLVFKIDAELFCRE